MLDEVLYAMYVLNGLIEVSLLDNNMIPYIWWRFIPKQKQRNQPVKWVDATNLMQ